jgi:putative cell wall-binding protein
MVAAPAEPTAARALVGGVLAAVLAATALLAALLPPPPAAGATRAAAAVTDPEAAAERIVFVRDGTLVLTTFAGRERPLSVRGTQPSWSPNGRQVAFRAPREGDDPFNCAGIDVHLMEADGTDPRRLAQTGGGCTSPQWSPDGGRILTQSGQATAVVDVSTGRVLGRTTPPQDHDHGAVWSPDGTRFALVEARPAARGIVVTRAPDTSDRRVVVDDPRISVRAVAWHPDGAHLVLTGTDQGIWLVRTDGGGLRRLSEVGTGGLQVVDAQPSPDGRWIAVGAAWADFVPEDRQLRPGLYLVGLDGSRRRLADGNSQLSWKATSDEITVSAGDYDSGSHAWYGEILVVRLDGSRRALTNRVVSVQHRPAAGPGVTVRLAGPSRVETAVAASRRVFPSAEVAVLARADAYPDALAGAPLASALGGPLLLTTRNRLHAATLAELRRLGTRRVVLLGSDGALTPQVAADLTAAGITVERIGGRDRFDTARRIAERLLGEDTTDRAVYVVEGANPDPGRGWPDAVAVSGLAALDGAPILLVTRGVLPEPTAAALQRLQAPTATIIGSDAAVSTEVEADITATGATTDRIAGRTRYATSALIAERTLRDHDVQRRAWLATGRDWPDALAAGATAAADDAVLLLVDRDDLANSPGPRDVLRVHLGGRAILVGGPDVISNRVRIQVERLAP